MRFRTLLLPLLLSFSFDAALAAPKKVVRLATFEAPPFMSESLPEQGAAIYALRQMLKKVGYTLEVTFAPFLRARSLSLQKNDWSGFFPVTDVNVTSDFVLSKTIYSSNWVFAERKSRTIKWNKPEDLIPYKIGNVKGYDLDEMLSNVNKQKTLKIDESPSDELNLLKLANSRIDLALIDSTMFEYLMKSSPKLRPHEAEMQLNPKIIHLDDYGVAFKKTALGKEHMLVFNKNFSKEEFTRMVELYFKTYLSEKSDREPTSTEIQDLVYFKFK
ncbi:Bacterial extracellular solute-binding protein, family 3 [compost metagenome]